MGNCNGDDPRKIYVIAATLACAFLLLYTIFFCNVKVTQASFHFFIKPTPATINASDALPAQFEQYKKTLDENYKNNIEIMDRKVTLLLTIIGIAVTLWVGINVINSSYKEDIYRMKEELAKSQEQIKKQQDEINEYNKILSATSSATQDLKITLDNLIAMLHPR